eukprot:13143119-Alexandrium_andersonii.AAC.1
MKRDEVTRVVTVTMTAYHESLVPVAISAARRRDLDSPLQPRELMFSAPSAAACSGWCPIC